MSLFRYEQGAGQLPSSDDAGCCVVNGINGVGNDKWRCGWIWFDYQVSAVRQCSSMNSGLNAAPIVVFSGICAVSSKQNALPIRVIDGSFALRYPPATPQIRRCVASPDCLFACFLPFSTVLNYYLRAIKRCKGATEGLRGLEFDLVWFEAHSSQADEDLTNFQQCFFFLQEESEKFHVGANFLIIILLIWFRYLITQI